MDTRVGNVLHSLAARDWNTSMRTFATRKTKGAMRVWTRSFGKDGGHETQRVGVRGLHTSTIPRRKVAWWLASTALAVTAVAGGAAYAARDGKASVRGERYDPKADPKIDVDVHGEALRGWEERWKEGRTAFHMETVHPKLIAHLDDLLGRREGGEETDQRDHPRVLVPLCGKTKDMTWLAVQGCDVFGVEIASLAVDQFFQENGLPRDVKRVEDGGIKRVHTSGNIAVLEGDLLALKTVPRGDDTRTSQARAGPLAWQMGNQKGGASTMDAVWDRGAMVAIEPELREAYADVIANVMKPKGRMLLLALQYGDEPEGEKAEATARRYGPPYSLSYQQVKRLFKDRGFSVQVLESVDTSSSMPPRFLQEGIQVSSVLMLLEKK